MRGQAPSAYASWATSCVADTLRDGIHELRAWLGHVNYRILHSIHGRVVAALLHALVKEDVVPEADIDPAVVRKNAYARDPEGHTFHGPVPWAVAERGAVGRPYEYSQGHEASVTLMRCGCWNH